MSEPTAAKETIKAADESGHRSSSHSTNDKLLHQVEVHPDVNFGSADFIEMTRESDL